MSLDLDRVWNRPSHRHFVEGLDPGPAGALLRLLIVATYADDRVSEQERVNLAKAAADIPVFDETEWSDFRSDSGSELLEELHDRLAEDREDVLTEIRLGLGDETARRHAFRMTVEFMQADEFLQPEVEFVRELGSLLEIEEEIVEFAIADAKDTG